MLLKSLTGLLPTEQNSLFKEGGRGGTENENHKEWKDVPKILILNCWRKWGTWIAGDFKRHQEYCFIHTFHLHIPVGDFMWSDRDKGSPKQKGKKEGKQPQQLFCLSLKMPQNPNSLKIETLKNSGLVFLFSLDQNPLIVYFWSPQIWQFLLRFLKAGFVPLLAFPSLSLRWL